MSTKDQLQFLIEGSVVERYHTRPGIKPQTNGHHQHEVAMLASLLVPSDSDGRSIIRAELLLACLTHDGAEQASSDISTPSKMALGIQQELHDFEQDKLRKYGMDYEQYLTDTEYVVLQLADKLSLLLYCCRELALGNRGVLLIWRRSCTAIESLPGSAALPLEIALRASNVYEAIKEIYHEVRSENGPDFDVFKS